MVGNKLSEDIFMTNYQKVFLGGAYTIVHKPLTLFAGLGAHAMRKYFFSCAIPDDKFTFEIILANGIHHCNLLWFS